MNVNKYYKKIVENLEADFPVIHFLELNNMSTCEKNCEQLV
jgi:hypothetical protein